MSQNMTLAGIPIVLWSMFLRHMVGLIDGDNLNCVILPNWASNDFLDGALFVLANVGEEKTVIEEESEET